MYSMSLCIIKRKSCQVIRPKLFSFCKLRQSTCDIVTSCIKSSKTFHQFDRPFIRTFSSNQRLNFFRLHLIYVTPLLKSLYLLLCNISRHPLNFSTPQLIMVPLKINQYFNREILLYALCYLYIKLRLIIFSMSSRGNNRGQFSRQVSRGGHGSQGPSTSRGTAGGRNNRGGNNGARRGGNGILRGSGRGRRGRFISKYNWTNIRGFNGMVIRMFYTYPFHFLEPHNYTVARPSFSFTLVWPENSPVSDYDVLLSGVDENGKRQEIDPMDIYSIPFTNGIRVQDIKREFESMGIFPESVRINDGEPIQDDSFIHTVKTSILKGHNLINILQIYCFHLETFLKVLFFSFYRIAPFSRHAMLACTDCIMCTFSSGKQGHYDICFPPSALLGKIWGRISRMRMKTDITITSELSALQDELKAEFKADGKSTLGPDLHPEYIFRPEELESYPICRGMLSFIYRKIIFLFSSLFFHTIIQPIINKKCLVSRLNVNNSLFNRTPEQDTLFQRNFGVNQFWIRRNQTKFEEPVGGRLSHLAELPDLRWVMRKADSMFATTTTDRETAFEIRRVYKNMKAKYGLDTRLQVPSQFHLPSAPAAANIALDEEVTAGLIAGAETRILSTVNQKIISHNTTLNTLKQKTDKLEITVSKVSSDTNAVSTRLSTLSEAQSELQNDHNNLCSDVASVKKANDELTTVCNDMTTTVEELDREATVVSEGYKKLANRMVEGFNEQENINQCLHAANMTLSSQISDQTDGIAMIGTVLAQNPATRHIMKSKCPDMPAALNAGHDVSKFSTVAKTVRERRLALSKLLTTATENPGTLRKPVPEVFRQDATNTQKAIGFASLPANVALAPNSAGSKVAGEPDFDWTKVVDAPMPVEIEEIESGSLLEQLGEEAQNRLPRPDVGNIRPGTEKSRKGTPGRAPLSDKTFSTVNPKPKPTPATKKQERYEQFLQQYFLYFLWYFYLQYYIFYDSIFAFLLTFSKEFMIVVHISILVAIGFSLNKIYYRMSFRDNDRPANAPGEPLLPNKFDNDAPVKYRIRPIESDLVFNQYRYLFLVIPSAFLSAIETVRCKYDQNQFHYLRIEASNLYNFVIEQRKNLFSSSSYHQKLCTEPGFSDSIPTPRISDKLFHLICQIVSENLKIPNIPSDVFHLFYKNICESDFTDISHNDNRLPNGLQLMIPITTPPLQPKNGPNQPTADQTPEDGSRSPTAPTDLEDQESTPDQIRTQLLQKWKQRRHSESIIMSNLDIINHQGDELREKIMEQTEVTNQISKILRIGGPVNTRSMIFPPELKFDPLTKKFREFILNKPQTLGSLSDPIDEQHIFHHRPDLKSSFRNPPPNSSLPDVSMSEISGLIIVSANLNKPQVQLERLIQEFPSASIFTIQELNVDSRHLTHKMFFPSHFSVFFHKPVYNNRIPEVWSCILVRNNIIGLQAKQNIAPPPFTLLTIEYNHLKLSICTFYRPHYDSYRVKNLKLHSDQEYDDYFIDSLNTILFKQSPLVSVITGDLNLQLIDPRPQDKKPLCSKLRKMFVNYTNLATEPTHVPHKRALGQSPKWSTIDIFMVKNLTTFDPLQYRSHTLIGSDGHQILSLKLNDKDIKIDNTITLKVARLAESNAIHDTAKEALSKNMPELQRLAEEAEQDILRWKSQGIEPDYKTVPFCEKLFQVMESAMASVMPSKTVEIVVNQSKYLFSPLTKLLRRMIFYLERRQRTRKLNSDERFDLAQFKIFYARMARRDRRRKITNIGDFDRLDRNDIYKIRNKLNPKNKKVVDTGVFTVEQLAEYYKSKFGNFDDIENYVDEDHWIDEVIENKFSEKDFVFEWEGPNRGSSLKKCFKQSKEFTKGYNSCLNRKIFSSWPTELIPLLLKMQRFNVMLGICPEFYHQNKVVAIPKLGSSDLTALVSRRFITVANFISSACSKQVSYILNRYAIENGLFSGIQHGFTSHRSAVTAVACLLYAAVQGLRARQSVIIFSLDAKRAYDSIQHKLIRFRMSKCCTPTMYKYISSYLEGRSGFIVHKGDQSDEIKLTPCGVPQGGCESPALFNLVVAGIHKYIPDNCQLILYADDISAVLARPDLQLATREATKLIIEVRNNLERKGITFHEQKTAFIAIGKPKNTVTIKLDDDTIIQNSDSIRILGIHLNYQLDFEYRITELLARIDLVLGLVYSLLPYGSRSDLLNFSRALIFGNLNFGLEILPLFNKQQYGKINSAITKVLFVIYGIPHGLSFKQSQRKMFSMANWIPFHLLHKKSILNFTNRMVMYDLCPNIFKYLTKTVLYNDFGEVPFGLSKYRLKLRNKLSVFKEYIFYYDDDIITNHFQRFFPFNLHFALNELPYEVSLKLGCPDFKFYIKSYFYSRCPHAVYKHPSECSECSIPLLVPQFLIETPYCPLFTIAEQYTDWSAPKFNAQVMHILDYIL